MELKKLLDRKISLQGRDMYALTTTLIYAVMTFAIAVNHEPFEDEVNVWMTLHNLGGIQLWKHIFEDGNPFFFFICLIFLSLFILSLLTFHLSIGPNFTSL